MGNCLRSLKEKKKNKSISNKYYFKYLVPKSSQVTSTSKNKHVLNNNHSIHKTLPKVHINDKYPKLIITASDNNEDTLNDNNGINKENKIQEPDDKEREIDFIKEKENEELKQKWIQLAGHSGSFVRSTRRSIMKKQTDQSKEEEVYRGVMGDPMKKVTPKFIRTLEMDGDYYIELEDLLQHFTNPNIMDVKMGTRTFLECEVAGGKPRKDLYEKMVSICPQEPNEEERTNEAITKYRYMQFRERNSSTANLGFRIDALKLHDSPPNTNLKKAKTKQQVFKIITEEFLKGKREVCEKIRDRLIQMINILYQSKFFKTHEFIGSSLLFIYDDFDNCNVWMIDFTKTCSINRTNLPSNNLSNDNFHKTNDQLTEHFLDHRSPWQLGNNEDGYLVGLDNLIQIFEEFLVYTESEIDDIRLQPSATIIFEN